MEKKRKINSERVFFVLMVFATIIALIILAKLFIDTPSIETTKPKEGKEVVDKTKEASSKFMPVGPQAFEFLDQDFIAFVYNSKKQKISFFYQDEAGKNYNTFQNIEQALQKEEKQLRFAMNAGIFRENRAPEGLFINEGKEVIPLNIEKGNGNFYLKPNGVFYIKKNGEMGILETNEFSTAGIEPQFATQSGPALVLRDTLHKAFNKGSKNLRVRNGVGIISRNEAVFLISKQPVNFYDFAMTFKAYFGCKNALYLDGVISDIYLPEKSMLGGEEEFSGIIGVVE